MTKLLTNYNNLSDKEKKEYEKQLKQLYIILGIATVLFYVLPFILIYFGGKIGGILLYLTIINVFTVFSFLAGFMHARKYDFQLIIPSAVAIYFLPTVMILYKNLSLIGLALLYFMLGLFGEFAGHLMLKRRRNKRQPIGLNRLLGGNSGKKNKKKK